MFYVAIVHVQNHHFIYILSIYVSLCTVYFYLLSSPPVPPHLLFGLIISGTGGGGVCNVIYICDIVRRCAWLRMSRCTRTTVGWWSATMKCSVSRHSPPTQLPNCYMPCLSTIRYCFWAVVMCKVRVHDSTVVLLQKLVHRSPFLASVIYALFGLLLHCLFPCFVCTLLFASARFTIGMNKCIPHTLS